MIYKNQERKEKKIRVLVKKEKGGWVVGAGCVRNGKKVGREWIDEDGRKSRRLWWIKIQEMMILFSSLPFISFNFALEKMFPLWSCPTPLPFSIYIISMLYPSFLLFSYHISVDCPLFIHLYICMHVLYLWQLLGHGIYDILYSIIFNLSIFFKFTKFSSKCCQFHQTAPLFILDTLNLIWLIQRDQKWSNW